jgi:hypothetical protein
MSSWVWYDLRSMQAAEESWSSVKIPSPFPCHARQWDTTSSPERVHRPSSRTKSGSREGREREGSVSYGGREKVWPLGFEEHGASGRLVVRDGFDHAWKAVTKWHPAVLI